MRTRSQPCLAAAILATALAACDGPSTAGHDAATDAAVDAAVDAATDAAVDAATDASAGITRVELSGGGRLTGGTLAVDLRLGGPLAPAPAAGGSLVATPASPIAR